jgi:ubiquinone/menaquinone biosynthesis C-methylase UbiE
VTRKPDVHAAVRAFSGVADEYERGRAGYPPEVVAALAEPLGIGPGTCVLDLAAGTGKLTRALVETGANVVAVEPLDGMRALLHGIDARAGTAEAIPLEDASVDAVTVAQAFHWFDGERALAEIHRVLRPGGGLGLVWNHGDTDVEWVERLDDLTLAVRWDDVPRARLGLWRKPFEATKLFTPLVERQLRHEVEADAESVRDRIASISFVARLPEAEQAEILRQVDAITAELPARFAYPYVTFVYVCRRVP